MIPHIPTSGIINLHLRLHDTIVDVAMSHYYIPFRNVVPASRDMIGDYKPFNVVPVSQDMIGEYKPFNVVPVSQDMIGEYKPFNVVPVSQDMISEYKPFNVVPVSQDMIGDYKNPHIKMTFTNRRAKAIYFKLIQTRGFYKTIGTHFISLPAIMQMKCTISSIKEGIFQLKLHLHYIQKICEM